MKIQPVCCQSSLICWLDGAQHVFGLRWDYLCDAHERQIQEGTRRERRQKSLDKNPKDASQ